MARAEANEKAVVEIPEAIEGFPNFGHLILSKMHNTRDLGGMPTKDGKRILPKRLLRSGELHSIADTDALSVLGNHDVRHVVDLRTDTEAEHAPDDPIVQEMAAYHHLPVFGASAIGVTHANGLVDNLNALIAAATNLREVVERSYAEAILGDMGIAAYRSVIEIVASVGEAGDGAVLWHCSAGKDRCGIASILIEHILGVSEEDIKKDYLATNTFSSERNARLPYSLAPVLRDVSGIDISPIFYVCSEYYDRLMGCIVENFGSLDGYMRDGLVIEEDLLDSIRNRYLA